MARPKKEKELTRTKHITLRLSKTQHDIITAAAKQAGLTRSAYIRHQLMDGKVIAKYEIVADVPEIKKLTAELGKIGSNINQIARHFNSGGTQSEEIRHSLNKCIVELYEMKYKVLKMAGDFHGNSQTRSS